MTGSESHEDITFQPKSPGQREDCINNSAEHTCDNLSVIEAVALGGRVRVRCCMQPDCKKKAAKIARVCAVNFFWEKS